MFIAQATATKETVDWLNAVYVPSVFFVMGIPVAIYTGVIGGRMALFSQTRMQAGLALQSAINEINAASDAGNLIFRLGYHLNAYRYTLDRMGHREAAGRIMDVVGCMNYELLKLTGADLSTLTHRKVFLGDFPEMPMVSDQRFILVKRQFLSFYFSKLADHEKYILAAKPSWSAMFISAGFRRWLNLILKIRIKLPPDTPVGSGGHHS